MNREELARVLRLARGRIRPQDAGLTVGGTRRVPGLRREEVATLAGISVDYVVPDDDSLARMVTDLRSLSETFDRLWAEAPALCWLGRTKTVDHPEVGLVTLDCESLTIPDSGQTLIVYSAEPGTEDAAKLELLRVLGTQRMSADQEPGLTSPWSKA